MYCSLWSECGVLGTQDSQEPSSSICAHESGRHHYRRLSRWTRGPINPRHLALSGRTEATVTGGKTWAGKGRYLGWSQIMSIECWIVFSPPRETLSGGGLRISTKFAFSLLSESQTRSRSHSLLLFFPLRFTSHTWAHRGDARLLLGGLSWAERVLGAGAQPRTLPPTRVTPRDKAALGAGGPGRPGCPTWYVWKGRQYRPIV